MNKTKRVELQKNLFFSKLNSSDEEFNFFENPLRISISDCRRKYTVFFIA